MATNEAKWPPSPCERVMNKDGDICADAATYRPVHSSYFCNHHADEAVRRLQRVNADLVKALEIIAANAGDSAFGRIARAAIAAARGTA